ncbi:MAG: HAMP domain-containing histidine kinase, partial [Spirosomaceae bacterium]|nr:HAMP domain-containing histidine kinase [Spirosomataceae bacterium]
KYGFQKIENLAWVLGIGWFVATLVVFLVGWVYAERALLPIKKLIGKVDEVTASRLDLRVEIPQEQDEIGQLAQRFNRMLDRLQEAFLTQKAFVSNASHELRTPLTAIRGQIQVALMDDDPDEWKQTLESVLEDTQNLTKLSNGLLTMASVSVEENTVALAPVSLQRIFEEVKNELLKAHPSYTVLLNSPPTADTTVLGNNALLRIALLNLTENGCKYSPNHTVNVAFKKQGVFQQITFQNTGNPIAADELPHIFKPFRRAANSARIAGHGIGLSLTERIVWLHRGSIAVNSSTQEGTTFTLQLPI